MLHQRLKFIFRLTRGWQNLTEKYLEERSIFSFCQLLQMRCQTPLTCLKLSIKLSEAIDWNAKIRFISSKRFRSTTSVCGLFFINSTLSFRHLKTEMRKLRIISYVLLQLLLQLLCQANIKIRENSKKNQLTLSCLNQSIIVALITFPEFYT